MQMMVAMRNMTTQKINMELSTMHMVLYATVVMVVMWQHDQHNGADGESGNATPNVVHVHMMLVHIKKRDNMPNTLNLNMTTTMYMKLNDMWPMYTSKEISATTKTEYRHASVTYGEHVNGHD